MPSQHAGTVWQIQRQPPDRADSGSGHHLLQLPLRIGATLRGAQKHVEREQCRMQRTFHVVVEDEFLHHEHAARLKRRYCPPQRDRTPLWTLAVQDVRQPRHIESDRYVVADEVAFVKCDPVA